MPLLSQSRTVMAFGPNATHNRVIRRQGWSGSQIPRLHLASSSIRCAHPALVRWVEPLCHSLMSFVLRAMRLLKMLGRCSR